ncbi:MAG: hypothetical protein FJX72_08000 [Armatimonadetes bacterium]|nr:hypothetical protein [Armatimonadota bacterium]
MKARAPAEVRVSNVGNALRDISRLIAVVFVAASVVGIAGCGGGGADEAGGAGGAVSTEADADSTEGDGAGTMGAPSLQMGGGMQMATSGGGPMAPMSPMGPMGMGAPGGATTGADQPTGAGPTVTTRPPNSRPDPFAPWWSVVPPPPPAITLVEPYRIATRETGIKPVEETVEVQEVPNRRVAGIATGAGVYALVEGPEGQTVVKAGDALGDYRVDSIRSRSIVLTRKVGNVSYTQEVPLTDVGSQRSMSTGRAGAPGGAGMMFRGGAGAPPLGGGGGGGVGAETEF